MSDDDLIRRGDAMYACHSLDPEGVILCIPAAQPAPVTVEEAARVLLDACPNPLFDQLKPLMMGEIVERFVGQNEDGEESYTRSVSWDTMKQVIRFALRALAGDKP